MRDFSFYLDKIGEIGFVEQALHSIVYVSGLPGVHLSEIVVFETGDIGQVFSIDRENCEILIFSNSKINVGTQVARTGELLTVPLGTGLLGKTINPLGVPIGETPTSLKNVTPMVVDSDPPKIMKRKQVEKPLETGVT